jgi:hypothetical protein
MNDVKDKARNQNVFQGTTKINGAMFIKTPYTRKLPIITIQR